MINTLNVAEPVIDSSRHFYVSVIDNDRYGLLLGPFDLHSQALNLVSVVRDRVQQLDSRAHWYGFGTCSLPKEIDRQGTLNSHPQFHPLLLGDLSMTEEQEDRQKIQVLTRKNEIISTSTKNRRGRKSTIDLDVLGGILNQQNREETS